MNQSAEFAFRSTSEADTERLAERLAARFQPGTVIGLDGDLGAGKTRFSQAVAKALGITEIVNSPTFTIIKEYEGVELPLYHMDVYRISMAEADELGLDDYFYGDGVSLVEWSSIITPILPPKYLHLFIQADGEHERIIRLTAYGEPYVTWVNELKRMGV
ncbi:tRNA (adenosine(37)-N6)-threonylcarbamoyltransferase complex ATPase subunit type 1 TsaE [Paenibacillus profundus]|uniref:tRNA threonylcarbamoyladenosine biosynthesis protein TsaE n=1 Tax=Paenibacillus profundus TaxID=1173085 RepID=A0ABS8YEX5_9BACL|nr:MULTISPECIES: tRNA (adenosine(37)-N6)-threonylcarbamoyltransferase complex ATPase subunit type 1 TsaE [Paenibacillus]MCE5168900.1 tRNA (adenosine(37)-N6)-threonylcarbamoyltransferase complex ATPase subunit type 1 TsaE [Paenibacillus profundus]MCM3338289.1 tRNA (adenosine(37)-N6)-threonylcarbamoyltransferase complex ATPase subunit type 1 TsaE [Paenibacillus sp. MER TA 81-3]